MIIDLQRKLMEIGRLRIGQQVATSNGKTRPAKLETWRFTSANETVIRQASQRYGGTVQPWQAPSGSQYEVISEATSLPVLVPPADLAFSQFYELWSAGGCVRRCDGVTETISDGQCLCDPDQRECKIHSRLSILLSDLSGLGVWRLETSGWYAARELSAAVDIISLAASQGDMLPARLRLEQRMVKRGGQTRRFAVPVLDIEVSPAQLLGAKRDPLDAGTIAIEPPPPGSFTVQMKDGHPTGPLTPVPDSMPEHPVPSIAAQAVATRERPTRKNAAQPIPATGIKPRTREQAASGVIPGETMMQPPFVRPHAGEYTPDEPAEEPDNPDQLGLPIAEPELITGPQLKKLSILLKEAGLTDRDAAHDYTAAAIGRTISSAKELTKDEASHVIDTLENEPNTP